MSENKQMILTAIIVPLWFVYGAMLICLTIKICTWIML